MVSFSASISETFAKNQVEVTPPAWKVIIPDLKITWISIEFSPNSVKPKSANPRKAAMVRTGIAFAGWVVVKKFTSG